MTKYSGSGWHKQSIRHSRARRLGRAGGQYATQLKKNIVTKIPSNITIDRDYFGFETQAGNKLKLRLGNWTTAGWHWDGNEKDFFGYLARIQSSRVRNDFLKEMKDKGLSLNQFKTIIKNSIKNKNGLYELSGDNALWEFGGYEPDYESIGDGIIENLNEKIYPQKLTDDEEKKFLDELDRKEDFSKTGNYDNFEKEKIKEFQKEALEKVDKATDWDDLMDEIEDMHEGWYEEAVSWQDDETYDTIYKAYDEVLKDKKFIDTFPKLQDLASKEKLREAGESPKQTKLLRYTKKRR